MAKAMTPSGVTTYKRKVSNMVTKATNLITEANTLLELNPNNVALINLSNKKNELLTHKLKMVKAEEEIVGVTIDDPQATQEERDTILKSVENHLRQADFPKFYAEIDEAVARLQERAETSEPASPTWRGAAAGAGSSTRQGNDEGNTTPISERSRSPSPSNRHQHGRPPQQHPEFFEGRQRQDSNRSGSNMEEQLRQMQSQMELQQNQMELQQSQMESHMEWSRNTMLQMQMDSRDDRKRIADLLARFAPGRDDTSRIRSVPQADGASRSTGQGASPGSTNTFQGSQSQWNQMIPQPIGFHSNNPGNHNGFNNGFPYNNPTAALQQQVVSTEQFEANMRMEQIKTAYISSIMNTLKPFSGEACDYPTFLAQFNHMVHNNPYIDPQMKQTLLTNLLPSALAREHQTTEVSEEKYNMIRQNLERQFNRQNCQFNMAMQELENINFPADDMAKLQSALNTYSTLAYKLQSEDLNPNDRFFVAKLVSKLPHKLRRAGQKMLSQGKVSLNDVMNKAYEIISSEGGFTRSSAKLSLGYDESYVNQINVNAVTQYQQRRREFKASAGKKNDFVPPSKEVPCKYCEDKNHSATECKISNEQKREAVHKKALCYNCLSEKHSVIECKSRFSCLNCGRRHFTGHCPLLSKKDKVSVNVLDYEFLEDDEELEKQLFRDAGAETPEF
ncbi:hypothetical protein CAEBREN_13462 [Caenorhabditis brenneri]|uniref:CCHC-type domain-containing protein n=1 Tax=Caenorhabditis brenneri TaxID=135651 RepID=G0P9L9_CAEBE|nr:hypothetical protein CAEBREN_13462 [Caenorhabditis brenneri]